MSGGFFRGTSATQDARFGDKTKQLLKSQKFPTELNDKVQTKKVQMDVIKPWIATRITELLGFEDEVLINMLYALLESPELDGKAIHIQLTGFLEKNTGKFMKELWELLLSAQRNISGIPQQFLDRKAAEARAKQAEDARIKEEIQRRKEQMDKAREAQLRIAKAAADKTTLAGVQGPPPGPPRPPPGPASVAPAAPLARQPSGVPERPSDSTAAVGAAGKGVEGSVRPQNSAPVPAPTTDALHKQVTGPPPTGPPKGSPPSPKRAKSPPPRTGAERRSQSRSPRRRPRAASRSRSPVGRRVASRSLSPPSRYQRERSPPRSSRGYYYRDRREPSPWHRPSYSSRRASPRRRYVSPGSPSRRRTRPSPTPPRRVPRERSRDRSPSPRQAPPAIRGRSPTAAARRSERVSPPRKRRTDGNARPSRGGPSPDRSPPPHSGPVLRSGGSLPDRAEDRGRPGPLRERSPPLTNGPSVQKAVTARSPSSGSRDSRGGSRSPPRGHRVSAGPRRRPAQRTSPGSQSPRINDRNPSVSPPPPTRRVAPQPPRRDGNQGSPVPVGAVARQAQRLGAFPYLRHESLSPHRVGSQSDGSQSEGHSPQPKRRRSSPDGRVPHEDDLPYASQGYNRAGRYKVRGAAEPPERDRSPQRAMRLRDGGPSRRHEVEYAQRSGSRSPPSRQWPATGEGRVAEELHEDERSGRRAVKGRESPPFSADGKPFSVDGKWERAAGGVVASWGGQGEENGERCSTAVQVKDEAKATRGPGEGKLVSPADSEEMREEKKRGKEEKRKRKEEKRARKEERRRRRAERRAAKEAAGRERQVDSDGSLEKGAEAYRGERAVSDDSADEQKRIEEELRKKALDSLRAKRASRVG